MSFPASIVYSTKSVSGLTFNSSRIVLLTVKAHPFPFLINFLYYAKDGKTLTYEEVIKDGRKTIKGRLSNEYDLNH